MASTDVAMCCLYIQIFKTHPHHLRCIYIGMGSLVLGYLGVAISGGVTAAEAWRSAPAKYHNLGVFTATAVVGIISNIIIVLLPLLPMPGIWALQMAWKRKTCVILFFASRVVYVPQCQYLNHANTLKVGCLSNPAFSFT